MAVTDKGVTGIHKSGVYCKTYDKNCAACNASFQSVRMDAKYCSKKCYFNFWYDRLGGRKKILDQGRVYKKEHSEKYRSVFRKAQLKRKYGMTLEQYQALFELQEGCCALCGVAAETLPEQSRVLHVDHDHKTGKIRGLLCRWCNTMLGRVEAHPGWPMKALSYLEENGSI